jgi:hypothetical protein
MDCTHRKSPGKSDLPTTAATGELPVVLSWLGPLEPGCNLEIIRMSFRILTGWITRRPSQRSNTSGPGAAPPAWWRCFPFGLLVLAMVAAGCGGQRASYQTAEVTGKVTYKGKALPGGMVNFVADKGGVASNGVIDENGNYKISAPIGDVHISVDNRMLEKKGPGGPVLRRPDSDAPTVPKGTYVQIPEKYAATDFSGLTYKVVAGTQTHDIPLE